jgi:hypothetical protein
VSSFSNETIVRISALKVLVSFLGASWKHFGAACNFLNIDITYKVPKKLQTASGKPPGSYKKFQEEILTIDSLLFWSKRWHQKDISK